MFFLVCCLWSRFFCENMKQHAIHRSGIHLPEVMTQGKPLKKTFHHMTLKYGFSVVFFFRNPYKREVDHNSRRRTDILLLAVRNKYGVSVDMKRTPERGEVHLPYPPAPPNGMANFGWFFDYLFSYSAKWSKKIQLHHTYLPIVQILPRSTSLPCFA